MSFNSDGYIMVDFTEVDFTRTNQTIDGLFERVKSVVGTNKFVLLINANHRTPLPATVTITNNQYVIQAVVYTFSIASNDLLHIQRNYPPESDLIQDDVISILTTWSSYKINEELQSKTEIDDDTISNISTWSSLNILKKLLPHETQTGTVVNITDGVAGFDFIDVKANITPVQESGTPSPSNPLPISGRSSVNITVNDDISDPQTENVYTIQLGDTYYGGVLDVTNGVLTVTHKYIEYDGSNDENWSYSSNAFRIAKGGIPANLTSGMLSNLATNLSGGDDNYFYTGSANLVYVNKSITQDVASLRTFLGLTPLQILYPIATPITVQLTPTQIELIDSSTVNIFADSGDVEVTYYATIQGYIDSKLSANRSLPTPELRNSINIEDIKTEQEENEK